MEGICGGVFGAKAGPTCNIFNLYHEVAHFIQLSDAERASKIQEGTLIFDRPQIWVYNRFVCEPETDQMSRRELETFVIQWLLLSHFGLRKSRARFIAEIVPLFRWIPDNHNFHSGAFHKTKTFRKFLEKEFDLLLQKWNAKKVIEVWKTRSI